MNNYDTWIFSKYEQSTSAQVSKLRNTLSLSYYCFFGMTMNLNMGFPSGSDGKESTCSAGDLGWEDPLEKEMATHSSILSWKIPLTEEPGGLSSMGLQKVGYNSVTK